MTSGALLLAGLLGGCKPPAFAGSEAAVLSGPPAELHAGQRAFWNDLAGASYGMVELGAGAYRSGDAVCKVARSTIISAQAPHGENNGFLYCSEAGNVWRIQPGVMCRPVLGQEAATCRNADGSYVTLPPV